ncbi:WxL protein peptidoglycan domain-containing protein [Streptomyces sp. NPDC002309]
MITTSARRIAAVLAACFLAVLPATAEAAPSVASSVPSAPRLDSKNDNSDDGGNDREGDGKGDGKGRTTFGVQPSSAKKPDTRPNFSYGATPGAVVEDHIAIRNHSARPLTLRVYAGDAFTTADGGFDLYAARHKSTDVGAWVKLRKTRIKVPARSHVIVPFTLTVPPKATPGDHTGGIVASLSASGTDGKGNKVAVDQRVGARVYLRVTGELESRLAVEDLRTTYQGTANPFGTGTATVTYTVRNTGNVRLAGDQSVRVRDLFGGGAAVAQPRDLTELLPGDSLKVTVKATGVLPTFRGTATVTLDPRPVRGDVKHRILPRVTRTEPFSATPWSFLALLAAVLAAVVPFLVRRRRRGRPRQDAAARRRGRTVARQTVGPAAVTVLAAGAAVLGAPLEARAADAGALAVSPAEGSDTEPITLTPAGPCPANSTHVIARVTGAGFPRGGQMVVGNAPLTAYPKAPAGSPAIPLTFTMRDYAGTAGFTTLRGTYTFTVSCLKGPFDLKSVRDFKGSLRFTDKSAYRDGTTVKAPETPEAPAETPGSPAPGSSEQPVPPTASGVGSGGTGADTGAAGESGPGARAGDGGASAAAVPVTDTAARDSSTAYLGWSVGGFAVFLLALLAGGSQWLRGRRARARDAAATTS